MHVVREQTSLHVLTDFPRLKRENHSGDFWAPGYLIIWGSQPHPIEIIQRFIRQTRQQQGIQMDEWMNDLSLQCVSELIQRRYWIIME